MDNPNISISDLFAGARESLEKYEQKQKQQQMKQRRRPERTQPTFATADKPLFGSLLKPSHLNKEAQAYSKNKTPSYHDRSYAKLETSNDDGSDDLKVSLTESQVGPHLHSNLDSIKKPPSVISANDGESSSHQDCTPIPEYVPLCEIRRRQAVEADLRASLRKVTTPKVKPLSWDKPSFHLPSNPNDAKADSAKRDEESSFSIQRGKRKECSYVGAPITNYCGLETIIPRPLPLSQSSKREYPHYRRQWAQEEVDGLVAFADKWITPANMKRRKK
mmetsp:Transcript_38427/g.69263  ORF Transcript_38427/g.69263 Transcript_38427/m.69263 type:complete len:276 (-) Transcript_38427:25-852(-)